MIQNPYAVLGIPEGASREQAAKAFRGLAKKWHPDKNHATNAREMFERFRAAFEAIMVEDRSRPSDVKILVLVTRQDLVRGIKYVSVVLRRLHPMFATLGLVRVDLSVPLHDLGDYDNGDTIDVELKNEGHDVLTPQGWVRTSVILQIKLQKVEVIQHVLTLYEALTSQGFYVTTKKGEKIWINVASIVCSNGTIVSVPEKNIEVCIYVTFPTLKMDPKKCEFLKNLE